MMKQGDEMRWGDWESRRKAGSLVSCERLGILGCRSKTLCKLWIYVRFKRMRYITRSKPANPRYSHEWFLQVIEPGELGEDN